MARQTMKLISTRLYSGIRQAWAAPAPNLSALLLASTLAISVVVCSPAFAQQAGGIKGKVSSDVSGQSVAGVVVTASSNVMPKPRTATTKEDGSYILPLLIPGVYELTFTSGDGTIRKVTTEVRLEQTSNVNLTIGPVQAADETEIIVITGSTIIREGNSSLSSSLGEDVLAGLPVGQDYRDLLKLVPGVAYSENTTRGPSAGGSGQDNKYGFDGVDVSLPMFGNLASEPSTHDIQNVSMDRGGAKAVGFNRSGGFAINTISKSGTNEFHGNLEYKLENSNFVSSADKGIQEEIDKSWITANLGGPLIANELFFYASYYRPEEDGQSKETAYGKVKPFKSVRDEYFGKLTWAPSDDLLFNLSQRSSEREDEGASIGEFEADSVSVGETSEQDIFILDGSYLIGDSSSLSFQYSKFKLLGSSRPDVMLSIAPQIGDALDINNLLQMGYFDVPSIVDPAETVADQAFNLGAQPLINQYGYTNDSGMLAGSGGVGAYSQINNQDFYRDSLEVAFEHQTYIGETYHNIHLGFKWAEAEEELSRLSNGWGLISYLGNRFDDFPGAHYQAKVQQMSLLDASGNAVSSINSSSESYNFEINDSIESGDFIYNIGVLISQDTLYGQGLREVSGNQSGYENAPGHKYEMYSIDWQDMIQPRFGVTWNYTEDDTLFANFASYNPEASSLARAASWDRNSQAEIEVNFDANGQYIDSAPASGSSGKFFAKNMKPRRIDEFTLGATKSVSSELYVRAHVRHRRGSHFWEDMPNDARLFGDYPGGGVPAHIAARGLYIDELAAYRDEVGGSSFVIAEVDDGLTKYWEVNLEAEWQGERTYLNASYVWSHYYGNFDQDNTTTTNDANTFIGSSFYGDGKGRMPWDNRQGTLAGDKPHLLKLYGYYTTDWEANVGAYLVYQSGTPWEAWDGSVYGFSSSTSRFAEPAGSRRTASHWQLDLNYTQDFPINDTFTAKFRADLFNVFDNQTGYNSNPFVSDETFGQARDYYDPRRLQLTISIGF